MVRDVLAANARGTMTRHSATQSFVERAMPPNNANPMQFLLDNPLKLYRDCMRLADLLAAKQGYPRDVLRATVRAPWRANQKETDVEKVEAQRAAAVRGLSNYMMYEASRGAMEGVPAFVKDDDDEEGRRR